MGSRTRQGTEARKTRLVADALTLSFRCAPMTKDLLLQAPQRCRDFSLLKRDSGDGKRSLSLFEVAHVLVCLDHVARFIVNADRGIV
ncbi:MAG: hypothetical protein DME82_12405 [Verrucomicrobia bacterium]|nr:MAG: hypothetical protein DME82_12405 [Verrucomicrobiota bacterium]